MEVTCSFKKIVDSICGTDQRYNHETVVPLSSCDKDISNHSRSFGISDVHSEIELILARASVFLRPEDISFWTICPAHRSSLGIGWRRGATRCRVPPGISLLAAKGKQRKANRRIGKFESKIILQQIGVFLPVGSGKFSFHVSPKSLSANSN